MTLPTIVEAGAAMRAGRLSSIRLTEGCLETIASLNPSLNAFITVNATGALDAAVMADRERANGIDRGPLHGIPVSLKDLIDVDGLPTTAASRLRQGHMARADAVLTRRLRSAGAVLLGKTNLHEFAFGTTNEDSAYGPARHPLDPARSPGGSSGGSAVAVATGMSVASVGTDTGGSIRIPSAACGLVGLKPTFGEVPLDGVVPLSTSLDHAGPLTRSVEDAAIVLGALCGAPWSPLLTPETRTLRLGIPRKYFFDVLDEEVAAGFADALHRLRQLGVSATDVEISETERIGTIYVHVSLPEAVAYHASTLEAQPDAYTPNVRLRLEAGRYLLAEDYVRARQGCAALRQAVDAALTGCDALMLPALAIPAPQLGATTVRIGGRDEPVRNMMLRLTQAFNISGHPAMTIPCGTTRAGFPIGVQLVGHLHHTQALLRVAAALEPGLREAAR